MVPLLAALPALVLLLAGVECLLVRLALPWRGFRPELFLHTAGLWLALGLLALFPAWLTLRLIRRRSAGSASAKRAALAVPVLLGWMVAPVLVHATLDRNIGLEANLVELASWRPWIEVALVLSALAVGLLGIGTLLARVRPRIVSAVALALALVLGFWPARKLASASAVVKAHGPNVLLLVWDTTRADFIEPYGCARPTTPNLERLAAQSILFEDSLSTASFTFSSHLTLLTGVYPSTHGARLLGLRYDPRRAASVTDAFRRAGWRTGGFVGTDVLAGRTGIRYGFEIYDDEVDPAVCETKAWKLVHDLQALGARLCRSLRNNGEPHWFQDFQRPGEEVLERALAWIENGDERPWFCFVNLYDAHWPYLPEADGRALVSPYAGPLDGYFDRSDRWDPLYPIQEDDRRHMVELYQGELLELDLAVDRFLRELELERGATAVLVTADHGEAFGESGQWKHEDVLEPHVRVPLLLRPAASAPEGQRISAPVSGVDVGPTLLALAGLEPLSGMEGKNLLGELDADRVRYVEDRDHSGPLDVRIALYRGRWKLVRRGLDEIARFELYDLASDPRGETDVSAGHRDVLAELAETLAERRAAFDAAEQRVEAEAGDMDALRGLGYAGGR